MVGTVYIMFRCAYRPRGGVSYQPTAAGRWRVNAALEVKVERNPFLKSLDQDNDEAGVRTRLASHAGYQESYKPLVKEWLREKDEARALAGELEALSVAKEANRIATQSLAASRLSSRYAIWAVIVAIIAAAISVREQIVELLLVHL